MSTHSQFHTLTARLGMDAETRKALVLQYSEGLTDSLRLLNADYPAAYRAMIASLLAQVEADRKTETPDEADRWRKRCLAAIGAWLTRTGCEPADRLTYIKQVAVRSAGKDGALFNDLTISQLRNVYNTFVRQNETAERAFQLKATINPSKN